MTAAARRLDVCPLIPLGDRLVIAPDRPTRHIGSIIMIHPPTGPGRGTVAAVGPGITWPDGEHDPCESQVGDRVVYDRYTVTDVTINDRTWLLVSERAVLARLG